MLLTKHYGFCTTVTLNDHTKRSMIERPLKLLTRQCRCYIFINRRPRLEADNYEFLEDGGPEAQAGSVTDQLVSSDETVVC